MAFQLALGCSGGVHRKCCGNSDPSTCSLCKSPTLLVITNTVVSNGPGVCGSDVYDGSYSIPSTFDSTCRRTQRPYGNSCSSPSRTETVDFTIAAYGYGLGPMPFTSLPSPGSVIVPYPYTSGMRIVITVLYAISTTVQESHSFLQDFEFCPSGTQSIPFLVTTIVDGSGGSLLIGSSPPTLDLVFP